MRMKQVILVRTDLGMPVGKIAAQASHASLNALLGTSRIFDHQEDPNYSVIAIPYTPSLRQWIEIDNYVKVCLAVNSELELVTLFNLASENQNIPAAMVRDSGLTIFNGVPTLTCCAIGPAAEDMINALTGNLKLL